MDAPASNPKGLTAADVLRRYKDEDLPAFCEVHLQDVNQVGNFGERPLHVAACRGIIEEIAALVEGGAEVNAPGEFGNTPLHEAVGQGHMAAIRFLLQHGASATAKNEFGQTPLDKARIGNDEAIVKLLEHHIQIGPSVPPPPVLDCARVLWYAVVDSSVRFSGRTFLFVDGKEVGRVPCLAICLEKKRGEVMLFHCDKAWNVLGCSAHLSVEEAKKRAEQSYSGLSDHWVDANVSEEAAEAYLDELFADQRCCKCGKRADEVERLVNTDAGLVCDRCQG